MSNKFLMIGPKSNIKNPDVTGGIIVLFEDLLTYCKNNNKECIIVDTNKSNYNNKLFAYIHILFLIMIKTPKVTHVSLHGTANDYLLIAPFALIFSKIFSKSFSVRKFAGNFIDIYENCSNLKKTIIKIVLKNSSYNFFETKYLVKYFKKFNKNTFWFPNVRTKSKVTTSGNFKKRFVYVGAVSKEKGIDILCEASKFVSKQYTIDIYGQLYDGYTKNYLNNYNVNYKGKLEFTNVTTILSQYDVLILPSLREGYPGVIIEALSVGLPVIASNLKGIIEMIDEKSSVLIDPMDVNQLVSAIELFNVVNYKNKFLGSIETFEKFDTNIQTKLYFNRIENK